MQGHVNGGGRALLSISIKAGQQPATRIDAWIDTGFTGELALPEATVVALSLPQSGTVGTELADGSSIVLKTYNCAVDWFGGQKNIQAVDSQGTDALLGVGLLREHVLTIDYSADTVNIL